MTKERSWLQMYIEREFLLNRLRAAKSRIAELERDLKTAQDLARDAALEEAAKICDHKAREHEMERDRYAGGSTSCGYFTARMNQCRWDAEDIRALKNRPPQMEPNP